MKAAGTLAAVCCICLFALGAALDDADNVTNTFFRPQAQLTTSDSSTEENIPGLGPTNPAKVQRSIPNLENLAPFLTILAPFLPYVHSITNCLGIYLPNSWDLASTGPTQDWLHEVITSFWDGFWGHGPRPLQAPTLLVAAPEAYKKLPGAMKQYSGLTFPILSPIKQKLVGIAVIDQLTRNMMLPAAPLLGTAANGTIIKTLGGVTLTLVVKPDGRYLVSNTTTAKLLATDVQHSTNTFQVVDSFIVPKINLIPQPPPPLLTQEEIDSLPLVMQMFRDSLKDMPNAISGMPGAWAQMIKQQLPKEVQQKLDAIQKALADIKAGNATRLTIPGATIKLTGPNITHWG